LATLEREIDRLYALPLDEFTARRNELAKRLKKQGEEDAADEVTALVKPSVPAWTINQLARRQKKEVQALLTTGTRLRKAQERALAGGGPDALQAARAEERESVRDLTQRAAAILEEAGRPATRAVLERVRATLGAAVLTDPERAALKAGRLTTEVQVSGFDALAGIRPAAKTAPTDELAVRRERKAELEKKRKRLEKRARDLADKADQAEEAAERAEEAAADARELADDRRRAADVAADELAEFERSPV
jgi:DNA repair exonuclease SbcCD ATPase subunit